MALFRLYLAYLETQKLVLPAYVLTLKRHCQGSKRLHVTILAQFLVRISLNHLNIIGLLILLAHLLILLCLLSNFCKTALDWLLVPMSLKTNIAFFCTLLQIRTSLEWDLKLESLILRTVHLKRRHEGEVGVFKGVNCVIIYVLVKS